MPMWRCPHCATPQPEAARCWVCKRSSTCCATCRHFRHSVAAQLGFCGLDRSRAPLAGDEIRACWQNGDRISPTDGDEPIHAAEIRTPVRLRRDFVPVEPGSGPRSTRGPAPGSIATDREGPGLAHREGPGLAEAPVPLLALPMAGPAWSLFPELDDLR